MIEFSESEAVMDEGNLTLTALQSLSKQMKEETKGIVCKITAGSGAWELLCQKFADPVTSAFAKQMKERLFIDSLAGVPILEDKHIPVGMVRMFNSSGEIIRTSFIA